MNCFTLSQKIELLEKWGFEIREIEKREACLIYYGKVKYRNYTTLAIFRDNELYNLPLEGYGKIDFKKWLDNVFSAELAKRLMRILT